jgi:hypothetical protein
MNNNYYLNYIEQKILVVIVELLQNGTISQTRAEEISAAALSLLTLDMSLDELYKKADELKKFPELTEIVAKIQTDFHNKNVLVDISKFSLTKGSIPNGK